MPTCIPTQRIKKYWNISLVLHTNLMFYGPHLFLLTFRHLLTHEILAQVEYFEIILIL